MDFAAIDAKRAENHIDQKVLCQRAGVNQSTYSQLKGGKRGGYVRTLEKLEAALDDMVADRMRKLKEVTGEQEVQGHG
ncbi:helix-turn-helix transcriptional regulator [Mesorhizobium sp. B1-1-7]|uniref:helix-turn-helix domain-containing protein n=1 Tax=Mesorhizobium sp. B1-1-7 TaxID=2589977 RepID=UPI00112A251B|nr:helix-turn-helix transcriptional regulator [Mesorhizobium sp. B1-1-7]TPN57149.1 helix-turn-helix transcriptional regulator [Mesorhizobium sp. B1-1-7]